MTLANFTFEDRQLRVTMAKGDIQIVKKHSFKLQLCFDFCGDESEFSSKTIDLEVLEWEKDKLIEYFQEAEKFRSASNARLIQQKSTIIGIKTENSGLRQEGNTKKSEIAVLRQELADAKTAITEDKEIQKDMEEAIKHLRVICIQSRGQEQRLREEKAILEAKLREHGVLHEDLQMMQPALRRVARRRSTLATLQEAGSPSDRIVESGPKVTRKRTRSQTASAAEQSKPAKKAR